VVAGFGRHSMPPPVYVTLTFDRLTLKLVCESHLRWGTFLPNLGNTVIRTLAVDGWAVTFGAARRGMGGLQPTEAPPNVTAHPSASYYLM